MNIFTKLRDFVSLNEADDYEYYEEEVDNSEYQNAYPEETPVALEEERQNRRRNRVTINSETGMTSSTPRNNVIGMPGAAAGLSEVVVVEPRSFEEMPQVIQALRERKSVVLNLTIIDPDEAQRAVDFVAGGTYAIDGHQERIGESIFLFTPSCVQVTTQAGVVHEAPSVPVSSSHGSVANQSWAMEQARMAQ
ncbi:cell division protein SepF [Lusitaniella coriacea LEGE 07167]|nr:cell division protein SepF [Lusitaniella coriacea]